MDVQLHIGFQRVELAIQHGRSTLRHHMAMVLSVPFQLEVSVRPAAASCSSAAGLGCGSTVRLVKL